MKVRIHRLSTTLMVLGVALLMAAPTALARTEMGDQDTPGKRMPVGEYLCGLGSYKARPCQVVKEGKIFKLIVPKGIGHSFAFEAQILGTDEANQLVISGALLETGRLCTLDGSDEGQACFQQSLIAVMTKKGKVWRGQLPYFIVRGADKKKHYKHGAVERFVIKPARKKK